MGRGVEVPCAEVAREGGRDRCEDPCSARATGVSRGERDKNHDEPISSAGSKRTAVAELPAVPRGRRKAGCQRRLVDVAEGWVLAGHDVVHLVAVEAVGARHGQQPDDHEAGDAEHGPGDGERREPAPRVGATSRSTE